MASKHEDQERRRDIAEAQQLSAEQAKASLGPLHVVHTTRLILKELGMDDPLNEDRTDEHSVAWNNVVDVLNSFAKSERNAVRLRVVEILAPHASVPEVAKALQELTRIP